MSKIEQYCITTQHKTLQTYCIIRGTYSMAKFRLFNVSIFFKMAEDIQHLTIFCITTTAVADPSNGSLWILEHDTKWIILFKLFLRIFDMRVWCTVPRKTKAWLSSHIEKTSSISPKYYFINVKHLRGFALQLLMKNNEVCIFADMYTYLRLF